MKLEQFHAKLDKLLGVALDSKICPGCLLQELLSAAAAIQETYNVTDADLYKHGVQQIPPPMLH